MKKTKVLVGLLVIALSVAAFTAPAIQAKTKDAVIWKMTSKKMTYRKAVMSSQYLGDKVGWENLIGVGKKKTTKISKKAKFYVLKNSSTTSASKKVSKKAFMKKVKKTGAEKDKQKGKTFYFGMACKITIKKGKIVKIKQIYQS